MPSPEPTTLDTILGLLVTLQATVESRFTQLIEKQHSLEAQLEFIRTQQLQPLVNANRKHFTRIANVPSDVVVQIFSWLDPLEAPKFARLSRSFNECLSTLSFAKANIARFRTFGTRVSDHENFVDESRTLLASDDMLESPHRFDHLLFCPNLYYQTAYGLLMGTINTISISKTNHGEFVDRDDLVFPSQINLLSSLIILEAKHCNLKGKLPEGLGDLHHLQTFSIRNNKITGSIPPSICRLEALEELDVMENELEGPIPEEIGNLTRLRDLDLCANSLTGCIPISIGLLTGLTSICLEKNELSGPIPKEIGSLKNLDYINISANKFTGSIPTEFENLVRLRDMDASSNMLQGEIPDLSRLTSLESLNLSKNRFTGTVPNLSACILLETVDLSDNHFTGPLVLDAPLLQLCEFNISKNQINGPIPTHLGGCINLDILNLQDNRLSGPIPEELGDLLDLHELHIGNNHISGQLPKCLKNMRYLRKLDLRNNTLTGSIPEELYFGSIDTLNLSNNHLIGFVTPFIFQLLTKEICNVSGNEELIMEVDWALDVMFHL
ncbi:UNVERIFIED_CONTAM: hypothetical protein HDU68_003362 [Siphonaria sp. JEL0065]|nr:hypothetical protein HDU68_003362 [Siphonaria sp. JEL0065]